LAKYYYEHPGDRNEIYAAAKKWKENCLIGDTSFIWENEKIWTVHNLNRFKAVFVDNPNESGSSFDEKLKNQLENESEDIYKLTIELLFIYNLFPRRGSIRFETKMRNLKTVAAWKDIPIDDDLEIFQGLKEGLGSTGTFYNTSKFYELSFLVLTALNLKEYPVTERETVLNDPRKIKQLAEENRLKIGKRVQMQHVFLHLVSPEKFERIASWGHKDRIVKSFDYLLKDSSLNDVDEKIYHIRNHFEVKGPSASFDFYDTSEVADRWNDKTKKTEPDLKPVTGTNPHEKPPKELTPNIELFGEDLVYENKEVLLEQVTTAIRNGKHIILTGPPGTGKSKLATKICELYNVKSMLVTASSNWSTYETIGGYRPNRNGELRFEEGIFLSCFKEKETNQLLNKWLIIDEINRADIDKAFGSLFSVLAGDQVKLPFESTSGELITIKPQHIENEPVNDYTYVVSEDWRIIATMNTTDKSSLYEMSYAFMRRFAFIPVGIPKDINNILIEEYLSSWEIDNYPYVEIITAIWKLINKYRKIGPAIVQDIVNHTIDNEDFTSPIILYVLPQFEGLPVAKIREFINEIIDETEAVISIEQLEDFVSDFFDDGLF